jgi:hypothetical protein
MQRKLILTFDCRGNTNTSNFIWVIQDWNHRGRMSVACERVVGNDVVPQMSQPRKSLAHSLPSAVSMPCKAAESHRRSHLATAIWTGDRSGHGSRDQRPASVERSRKRCHFSFFPIPSPLSMLSLILPDISHVFTLQKSFAKSFLFCSSVFGLVKRFPSQRWDLFEFFGDFDK